MASREAYARCWAQHEGYELTVGVELRAEVPEGMTGVLLDWAYEALRRSVQALEQVAYVEAKIKEQWPGRAYFIETESLGRGVQVFQPYGLPRHDIMPCPAPGEDGLRAWATFGTWEGPGHRPGCEALPRTALGCYCGGDHQ